MIYVFIYIYISVALVFLGIGIRLKQGLILTIIASLIWPLVVPFVLGLRIVGDKK
jgi:hypothetical protein